MRTSITLSCRAAGLIGVFLFLCATAFGQEPVATLEEMRQRTFAGDKVRLIKTDGEVIDGRLIHIGEGNIEIRTEVNLTFAAETAFGRFYEADAR